MCDMYPIMTPGRAPQQGAQSHPNGMYWVSEMLTTMPQYHAVCRYVVGEVVSWYQWWAAGGQYVDINGGVGSSRVSRVTQRVLTTHSRVTMSERG